MFKNGCLQEFGNTSSISALIKACPYALSPTVTCEKNSTQVYYFYYDILAEMSKCP